jgi:hypothetical protein
LRILFFVHLPHTWCLSFIRSRNTPHTASVKILETTQTMPSLVSEYVAGTLFGAALFAAGVFAPSTIVAQMKLEDFTMVKAMLGASATSA